MAVAVARGANGTHVFDRKAFFSQAFADEMRAGLVGIAWRVDGRDAHQRLREGSHLVTLGLDALQELVNSRIHGSSL